MMDKKKTALYSPLIAALLSAPLLVAALQKSFVRADWGKDSSLSKTLQSLGEPAPAHALEYDEKMVEQGRDIAVKGFTQRLNGAKTAAQSKYFQCIDCHNTEAEDPDLAKSDPDARLTYAIEKNLPFLPGTTFKGIVNRETWYNGDYEKKYGDLVKEARNSLIESTKVCATQCSQGRALEEWEMKAMMAYFWSLEYKLGELKLSDAEFSQINSAKSSDEKKQAVAMLKSKYLLASPAHMQLPPEDRQKGYALQGDAARGAKIYELSCRVCHADNQASHFPLDYSSLTFKFLDKHTPKYSQYSIYQVIRWGTYPIPGNRAYMPWYSRERMSDQQVEDLRAFITAEAKKGS